MTERKITYLTHVPDTQVDSVCGRKFWLEHFEAGRGIIRREDVIEAALLKASLTDLRTIASTPLGDLTPKALQASVDDILKDVDIRDYHSMSLLYRRLGWLVAWALFVEPTMRPVFEDIYIPPQISVTTSDLIATVPAGRLMRYRQCREVMYVDFVPTYSISSRWKESWARSSYPSIAMKAAAETARVDVNAMQVRGLSMGFMGGNGFTLNHPYVTGYQNIATGEWTCSITEGSKQGWRQTPVWQFEGGLVQWVQTCGEAVAQAQFPVSSRLMFNRHIFDAWVAHQVHREAQVLGAVADCYAKPALKDVFFPQNTLSCRPVHGESCSFQDICWGPVAQLNPLIAGLYIAKVPPTHFDATPLPNEAEFGLEEVASIVNAPITDTSHLLESSNS